MIPFYQLTPLPQDNLYRIEDKPPTLLHVQSVYNSMIQYQFAYQFYTFQIVISCYKVIVVTGRHHCSSYLPSCRGAERLLTGKLGE